MKITRRQLRRIILNEVKALNEGVNADQMRKSIRAAGIKGKNGIMFYGSVASGDQGTIIAVKKDNGPRVLKALERLGLEPKDVSDEADTIKPGHSDGHPLDALTKDLDGNQAKRVKAYWSRIKSGDLAVILVSQAPD